MCKEKEGCIECHATMKELFAAKHGYEGVEDKNLELQLKTLENRVSHDRIQLLAKKKEVFEQFFRLAEREIPMYKEESHKSSADNFGSSVSLSVQLWAVNAAIETIRGNEEFFSKIPRVVEFGGWTNALLVAMLYEGELKVVLNEINSMLLKEIDGCVKRLSACGLLRENQIAIYSDSAVGFYHDEKNMPKGGVPDIVVAHNLLHFFSNKEEEEFLTACGQNAQAIILSFNSLEEYAKNKLPNPKNEYYKHVGRVEMHLPSKEKKNFHSYISQSESAEDFIPIEEQEKKWSNWIFENGTLYTESIQNVEKLINPERLKDFFKKMKFTPVLSQNDPDMMNEEEGLELKTATHKVTHNMIFAIGVKNLSSEV